MSRCHAVMALVVLSLVVGCKEKTKVKYKTDKATEQALTTCEESRTSCQKELSDLRLKAGKTSDDGDPANDADIVLKIEGKTIKVVPAVAAKTNNHKRPPVGDAKAKDLYKAFQAKVTASRGSFRKCYTNALKKKPNLQGQVISMNLFVRFAASGQARGVALSKGLLGPIFQNCMNGVVKRWKLPAAPRSYKFQAPITLTPQ